MSLFDLSALHVHVLSAAAKASSGGSAAPGKPAPGKAGPSKAALFDSLQSWFDAQLPMLATQLPHGAVETTLRVFLAPQQSVRQGLQHVTFSVDWVRVQSGGDAATEPYSTALLHRLGMAGRRPPKMLLVMMYRAEHNQVTDVWVDVDREGLGAKKGATLDDVLLSDVFDTCLTLARKGGAVGSLDPIFHVRPAQPARSDAGHAALPCAPPPLLCACWRWRWLHPRAAARQELTRAYRACTYVCCACTCTTCWC